MFLYHSLTKRVEFFILVKTFFIFIRNFWNICWLSRWEFFFKLLL